MQASTQSNHSSPRYGVSSPTRRVHEEPAQAHAVHDADLAAQFLRLQLAVPGPEGLAAVFTGGIGQSE